MHSIDAGNRERIANLNRARTNCDGQVLVAVVNVRGFARASRRSCLRGVVLVGTVHGHSQASASGQTVSVVKLVGVERRHHADVGLLVCGQRLALQGLTPGQVVCHAVVVAG